MTFHLADSFPTALRREWEHLWRIEDQDERRTELEAYLDKGLGDCLLQHPEIGRLVEDNMRHHSGSENLATSHLTDGPRYELRAWVVMPNHVHVLFRTGSVPMSTIVEAWKKNTARLANRLLGRKGTFWQADYFDTYMRDSAHDRRTIRYIENNPVKAKFVREAKDWPWSSARFRDEYGNLDLTKV